MDGDPVTEGSRSLGINPHPKQLLGSRLSFDEREKIAAYIESAYHIRGIPALLESCYLGDGPPGGALPYIIRTDGEWIFLQSLAYYFRCGVRLPEEFIAKVRSRDYCPPTKGRAEPGTLPTSPWYWPWWSLKHSRLSLWTLWHVVRLLIWIPLIPLVGAIDRIKGCEGGAKRVPFFEDSDP